MSRPGRGVTRRDCLGALAAAGVSLAGREPAQAGDYCRDAGLVPELEPPRGVPLGLANPRVTWGTAIEAPGLYDPKLLAAIVAEAPNCLAIGSGLKFGNLFPTPSLQPAPERWRECDDVVALAARLGVPVRGDCLSWNDWLPDWLTAIAQERRPGWQATLRRHFEAQFEAVFAHFRALDATGARGDLRWTGVVNEPFNPWLPQADGTAAWRPGAWLDAYDTGPDGVPGYIHRAFELGAQHGGPGVALFVNESNADNDRFGPVIRPALLDLVDALQRKARRVDAVGLECHLMPQWMTTPDAPDWRPFVAFLRELERRGLKIYLTELDVNDCSLVDPAARDALVGRYIRSFVEAALAVPAVTMVTDWDFSDRYSWLRGSGVYPHLGHWAACVPDPECPRPSIYDEAMRPKLARRDLFEALRTRR